MFTRVCAVTDPREAPEDPEYVGGLRLAIAAALDFGIDSLESSEDRSPPTPTALLSQARLAARSRVSLDTVLRRYFAGYTLLSDSVIEETERVGLRDGGSLKRLLRVQAADFDQLLSAITEEYNREAEGSGSSEERRARRVQRLLDGELANTSDLAYEFDGWHVGILASGPEAHEWVGELAAQRGCRQLRVRARKDVVWAWLGSRRNIDPADLMTATRPVGLTLATGEPSQGLFGWRLTHRQAKAALPIARRNASGSARYAEVPLLAAALRDDLLAGSLRTLYLDPLTSDSDGGEKLLGTLQAYFEAGCSVSSAAAAMCVSRQTVSARLRAVEERVGRSLGKCGAEMETALQLRGLSQRQPR